MADWVEQLQLDSQAYRLEMECAFVALLVPSIIGRRHRTACPKPMATEPIGPVATTPHGPVQRADDFAAELFAHLKRYAN